MRHKGERGEPAVSFVEDDSLKVPVAFLLQTGNRIASHPTTIS